MSRTILGATKLSPDPELETISLILTGLFSSNQNVPTLAVDSIPRGLLEASKFHVPLVEVVKYVLTSEVFI